MATAQRIYLINLENKSI